MLGRPPGVPESLTLNFFRCPYFTPPLFGCRFFFGDADVEICPFPLSGAWFANAFRDWMSAQVFPV